MLAASTDADEPTQLDTLFDRRQKYVMLACKLRKGDIFSGQIIYKSYTDTWIIPAQYIIKEVLTFVTDQIWKKAKVSWK